MIGILVALAISWLLLWLFFKEHITVLGLVPNSKRIKEFLLGIVPMAIFCSFNLVAQSYFKESPYTLNHDYGIWDALNAIWWTFKAALFEEILFRGAILYILIRKIGLVKGCIIGAIAFGIYHWFSYNMFNRGIIPMIYVFLVTGAAGWMFAYAFAKTKSIYASLGLHFGWIVMSIVVFSAGPLGNALLISKNEPLEMSAAPQLFFFLFQAVIVPGLVTWYYAKKYRA